MGTDYKVTISGMRHFSKQCSGYDLRTQKLYMYRVPVGQKKKKIFCYTWCHLCENSSI
jgi:hypothetical protein